MTTSTITTVTPAETCPSWCRHCQQVPEVDGEVEFRVHRAFEHKASWNAGDGIAVEAAVDDAPVIDVCLINDRMTAAQAREAGAALLQAADVLDRIAGV